MGHTHLIPKLHIVCWRWGVDLRHQRVAATYPVTIVQAGDRSAREHSQLGSLREWPPHPDNLTKWRAHAKLGLKPCIHNTENVSIFGPNTASLTKVQLKRIQYMNKYTMEPLLLNFNNSVGHFAM